MADIVTGTVSGQVDVTQLLMGQSDIRRETAKEASDLQDSVKTAGWANSDRTGTEADRIVAQDTAYFVAAQSQNFANATALAALKAGADANFSQTLAAIQLAAAQGTAASQLGSERIASAVALGQSVLGNQLVQDGNATRALMNTLKMDELNRMLIERNAESAECRGDARYYRDSYGNSQFAAVTSQMNAFQSQLQEARQGTVNFGTMSGQAGQQTSTANNVR